MPYVWHGTYELECPASYVEADLADRMAACNGVGPDWFPAWLRWLMNGEWMMIGASAKPAADIHDWEYVGAESEADIHAADADTARNGVKIDDALNTILRNACGAHQ